MDKPQLHHNMPDTSQLSVLGAIIILAYVMSGILSIPESDITLQLPGFYFSISINIQTILGLLVAGITAAGSSWLFRSHPTSSSQSAFHHWIIPALTALVIGILLFQLPYGLVWVLGLILGGVILVLVLLAEFISLDKQDVRYPLAVVGLTSISYALFLILAVSLRISDARLFIILPAIMVATWFVSLRIIHLRFYDEWMTIESGIIALIVGQVTSAFHYWPFSPISYGLVILGTTYALNNLMIALIEGKTYQRAIRGPLLGLLVSWIMALVLSW